MAKKGALNRKESLTTKAKREASILGGEIAKSSKNAASAWKEGAKSIASVASKYGTNWKSGAKDLISKGKSITSKIGNLFSKSVKQATLDYKGGVENIITEKILTEKRG